MPKYNDVRYMDEGMLVIPVAAVGWHVAHGRDDDDDDFVAIMTVVTES